ncbi:acyl-CoA N-acyltransferase [Crassisporium funariophilum]|nr:acyl-CoA N-acyltransferase [Crassisporium funariophilum]
MPATHVVPIHTDVRVYTVNKNGVEKAAHVLQKRHGEVYVHYVNTDKRMDEWVPEGFCRPDDEEPKFPAESTSRKRKRGKRTESQSPEPSSSNGVASRGTPGSYGEKNGKMKPAEVVMTEDEFDLRHHQQLTAKRNFDMIIFDVWKIKPWYYSPYPLIESESEDFVPATSTPAYNKIPGVARATARSHGRTSDLLAGGLSRHHNGEAMLWVCHFCFKYMADGVPWESHKKDCKLKHPPGKKVYQRGAHTIWEVDGVKDKLYCQNLSLFGKLFIDVKTLFFDCDNFLFYILTDAKSSEDHILGFFSKEKVSYDDYNLACIMTLPQYQRKGYGMLMIEFSYELSRRANKVGTPERPLSDLGLRSYLAYWVSTLIRFFRRVLCVLPPEIVSIRNVANFPNMTEEVPGDVDPVPQTKRNKKAKGFQGEVTEASIEKSIGMMPFKYINDAPSDPLFTTERVFETSHREDGGAETHVKVECTLAEISRATNLRVEDAAFALNECGLLMRRLTKTSENDTVVITRSLVEAVAKERNVKIMYMDLSCVIIQDS